MEASKQDRFWNLVTQKLSGAASSDELWELNKMLTEDPELYSQMQAIENLWKSKANQADLPETDAAFSKHLQRLSSHLAKPALTYDFNNSAQQDPPNIEIARKSRQTRTILLRAGMAASLLIFLSVFYFKNQSAKDDPAINLVSTKSGSKLKVQLPDGSQVWLNSDTKLSYNKNYGTDLREVYLEGEAFFDVTKDKLHPFVIHTNTIELRVFGTAFNVRNYNNEKKSAAILIRGSIEVTMLRNPSNKIILKPGEKIIVDKDLNNISTDDETIQQTQSSIPVFSVNKINLKDNDSAATETLWIRNKLAFDNERLEEIAFKLEHWYSVKIEITSETLKQYTYSGVFENQSLAEVMEALRLKGKFNYAIDKSEVTIKP
ncbi:MAG: FecR family protein [Ferruginibacter sp.]